VWSKHTAAFTVAELGVMLPDDYTWSWPVLGEWICAECVVGEEGCTSRDVVRGATEAQARANMLIELLECGQTTPSEVNQRLNE